MYDPDIHNHDYQPIADSRFDVANQRPHVTIYSDGSFKPDIRYGGYGTLMQCDGNRIVIYGGSAAESNNRMELRMTTLFRSIVSLMLRFENEFLRSKISPVVPSSLR